MKAFLISMGSLGDMLPFVYLGRSLADRGHEVVLLGCEEYQPHVRDARIEFHPIMSAEVYRRNVESRKEGGGQVRPVLDFFRWSCSQIEPIYRLLRDRFEPGQTVVCAQSAAIGARVAQERHGVPLVTAHLQPIWMRSAYDMPPMPRWMSRIAGRTLQGLADVFVDNTFGREVDRTCRPLGVIPGKGLIRTWWNSPQCILGLFPDWYSPPQIDWPAQTVLAGFPVPEVMDPEFDRTILDRFLDSGEPPLVFSQGSNDPRARQFFETSLDVAGRLGLRAVLISRFRDLIPCPLPDGVERFSYVPLDALLPRAAAHVHHGGVGTIAQTLKAGIPQITVPSAFDQPDNSERLARLGVSVVLKPKNYTADHVAGHLERLLGSEEVRSRCRDYRDRIRNADPFRICREVLERLAAGQPIDPASLASA